MYDSRLIGIWKSDRRKTAREIAARCAISEKNKTKLREYFRKASTTIYQDLLLLDI
jgi:hypothetical protein